MIRDISTKTSVWVVVLVVVMEPLTVVMEAPLQSIAATVDLEIHVTAMVRVLEMPFVARENAQDQRTAQKTLVIFVVIWVNHAVHVILYHVHAEQVTTDVMMVTSVAQIRKGGRFVNQLHVVLRHQHQHQP